MRVGAAEVPVCRLVRSQYVYVTVGTTRTAMNEIVLMTTLPLYSTHGKHKHGSSIDQNCGTEGRTRLLSSVCHYYKEYTHLYTY